MTVGSLRGQVVTGVGQFVQQGDTQQSGFLARLQANTDRFRPAVYIGAEQTDCMARPHRQAPHPVYQVSFSVGIEPGSDALHEGVPDFEITGQ